MATDNNIAPSVTAPGFTVTMAPPGLGIYDHDETGAHATQGTKYLLPYRLSGAFDVTFTHTTPVNAVGFDITDYETGPSFPLTFSYSGGTFVAADASVNGATEFFGIIDRDQPVTPYVLHHPVAANGDGWGVDDVSSGIAPNLPGAPALPLLLAPLAALGWMVLRRRVRRSATL